MSTELKTPVIESMVVTGTKATVVLVDDIHDEGTVEYRLDGGEAIAAGSDCEFTIDPFDTTHTLIEVRVITTTDESLWSDEYPIPLKTTQVEFHLISPQGGPLANTGVNIRVPGAGFQQDTSGVVVPRNIHVTTNASGKGIVNLYPMDQSPYSITALDWESNTTIRYEFFVPDSDFVVRLQDLVLDPAPSNLLYDVEAIASITKDKVEAQEARILTLEYKETTLLARDTTLTAQATTETARDTTLEAQDHVEILEANTLGYSQDADASMQAAQTAQTGAETAETAAKASEDAAAISETNAGLSEDAASASETAAASSESNANQSKIAASNSASDASDSAHTAAESETAAAESETNAALSEAAASDSELAAANSESNAKTSENRAGDSAADALTSEQNSALSEDNAKASELASASSESAAASSEANASSSETNAATSATEAQTAETGAKDARAATESLFDQFGELYLGSKSEDPTVDNDGEPLQEGASYWNSVENLLKYYTGSDWVAPEDVATTEAKKAKNSAEAAETSETNAASSEQIASNKADEAAVSETNAGNSETAAASSETNASNSASDAATSATNAQGAADTASTKASEASASASDAATSEMNAADSAQTAEEAAADAQSVVDTHSTQTDDVHGVPTGQAVEWKSSAQDKADTAESNANSYTDTHEASVDNVHGIPVGEEAEWKTSAQAKVDAHSDQTGDVHGIPEGESVEWQAQAQGRVDAHAAETGGIHGIPSGQNVIHTGNYIAGRTGYYPASLNDYSAPTFTPIGVNLSEQVQTGSYRKSVVALVDLDNESISRSSWSAGVLQFNRRNGLRPPITVNVNLQKRYNEELMRGWVSGGSYEPGIYPCTFRYNNRTYGGVRFYFSAASHHNVIFFGITNFAGMFGLDYYDTDNNTVLEQEVYDTLSSSPWYGGNPSVLDIGERPAIGGDEIMIDGNGNVVKA